MIAVSMSALFAGSPLSVAEPYGDDDGGSSYDSGATNDAPAGSGTRDQPSEGGNPQPAGGGMQQEPSDGGMQEQPASGGTQQEPSGGMTEQPGSGGMPQDPGAGMNTEPGGGGMNTEPGGGGMNTEPGGGGMNTEPGGGGGMNSEPGGGGMNTQPGGGGMNTESGGGLATSSEVKASPEDVATANKAPVVDVVSTTVSTEEVTTYYQSIESTFTSSTYSTSSTLTSPISRWNSNWVGYDRFYRPVFTNPYASPMQVVYDYGGRPQSFTIAPLQRAAIDVPTAGIYNFTSMTRPASGPPTNVSVGSFSGGGYQPAPGQTPPQKPAEPASIKNALVRVKFTQGASDPFRVTSLTDLGKDPSLNNATKVLLDGEVPAWGEWSKNDNGEAMFDITETQLMPGIRPPAQEPLPGYKVKLAATSEASSWVDRNKTAVVVGGALAGAFALIGVGLVALRRRREAE
jgi:hypothetical protein